MAVAVRRITLRGVMDLVGLLFVKIVVFMKTASGPYPIFVARFFTAMHVDVFTE